MENIVDFTKDSEYIRLFEDDEVPEKFMESVYKQELGPNFEKMEDGVATGEVRLPPLGAKAPFDDSSWPNKKE